jgi:hypothetical protein
MFKRWRLFLALLLIGTAFGLRVSWLRRDIWNMDEGTTFTMAQQVRAGAVLYRDAADNRTPLVPYLKAAVLVVAGDWNARAVHVVVALLVGGAAVLLWQIARRLGDEVAGIAGAVACTAISFLLLDPMDALAAHTEWFMVFFTIPGYWFFVRSLERPGYWAGWPAGVCFGLACLCKQPAVFDLGVTLVLCGLLGLTGRVGRGTLAALVAGEITGLVAVLGAALAWFASQGALGDLVFYAWTYNTKYYMPVVALSQRLGAMQLPFVLAARYAPAVLILGGAAAPALLWRVGRGLRQRPAEIPLLPWLILGATGAGLVATALSGRAFDHYCIQVIPGLSLACGWMAARMWEFARNARANRSWQRWFFLALLALAAVSLSGSMYRRMGKFSRDDDYSRQVGDLVRRQTQPSERVFVWGFVPELYLFSQRLPCTRFLYANFLTGLIPWTNLDPMIDTSDKVVPGAWDRLWEDFQRWPPAMIIDTGGARGYLKYPLNRQTRLWDLVQHDFAQVEMGAETSWGVRLFRRLLPVEPAATPPATGTEGDAVQLAVSFPDLRSAPILTVSVPAGTTLVEIYENEHVCRRLALPSGPAAQVAFFLDHESPGAPPSRFQAAAYGSHSVALSRRREISADDAARLQAPGPVLQFGGLKIPPLECETILKKPLNWNKGRWRMDPPSRLVFPRLPGMAALSFSYGMDQKSTDKSQTEGRGSDGIDVIVTLEGSDGKATRLFWRRMDPLHLGSDVGPQTSYVTLPRDQPGQLVLAMTPGPNNDPSFDWSYWGELRAQPSGPDIKFGDRPIMALDSTTFNGEPMRDLGEGRWSAHAPSRVVYERPATLAAVTFSYGLDERAYADENGQRRSDGIGVAIDFEPAGRGQTQRLFDRLLDPFAHPADRGLQTNRVTLPPGLAGRLVFLITPGPQNNTSFDWAYWAEIRGEPAP